MRSRSKASSSALRPRASTPSRAGGWRWSGCCPRPRRSRALTRRCLWWGLRWSRPWRTRKHLKGDYLNLHDLGAALGVIVLLGDGDDIDATRRFAQTMVDRPGPRVLVWSEQDVRQFLTGAIAGGAPAATVADPSEPVPAGADEQPHAGKYRALWRGCGTSLGSASRCGSPRSRR